MRVPAERRAARGDLLLSGGCLAFSLLALALPSNWAAGASSALRHSILRPIVMLQERAAVDRTARFQLASIEVQRDSLGLAAQAAAALAQENTQLRQLLGVVERVSLPHVGVEVLHQGGVSTDARMLLIGAGTSEGIARFDPVVTADGLLGMVWDAGSHSSSVLTWLHPEFRAHAVTANGSIMGIVGPPQSQGALGMLELNGVALRDTVDLGTVVYTSSLGGVYPRGIPIGRVTGVALDSLTSERVYRLTPLVNPGSTAHALVLKNTPGVPFLPLPVTNAGTKP